MDVAQKICSKLMLRKNPRRIDVAQKSAPNLCCAKIRAKLMLRKTHAQVPQTPRAVKKLKSIPHVGILPLAQIF
jgi:hypothetical protein